MTQKNFHECAPHQLEIIFNTVLFAGNSATHFCFSSEMLMPNCQLHGDREQEIIGVHLSRMGIHGISLRCLPDFSGSAETVVVSAQFLRLAWEWWCLVLNN